MDMPSVVAGGLLTGGVSTIIAWLRYIKKDRVEAVEIQVKSSVKLIEGFQAMIDAQREQIRELEARFEEEHNECQQMKKTFENQIALLQKALHDLKI